MERAYMLEKNYKYSLCIKLEFKKNYKNIKIERKNL